MPPKPWNAGRAGRAPSTSVTRLKVAAWRTCLRVLTGIESVPRARALRGVQVVSHHYGDGPERVLDHITARDAAPSAPRPPIVYIHGGGWTTGSRALLRSPLAAFARRGFDVYNIDYPLSPEHPFPIPLQAVLEALRWVRRERPSAEHVVLMGDSAGANLATMAGILLSNPTLLRPVAPDYGAAAYPRVDKVVSLYGVLDRFSWLEDGFPLAATYLHAYAGDAGFEKEVTAANAITPADLDFTSFPDTLLVGCTADPLVRSTKLGHELLSERDGRVETAYYPNAGHGLIHFFWKRAYRDLERDVLAFLEGGPGGHQGTSA